MRGDDIVFYCSLCGQKIAVQQAHGAAGRPAECPACRRRITVPSPADFAPPSATTESGSPAPAPTPPRPGTKRVIFKKRPPTRTMPSWMQPKDNPPPRGSDPLPAGDWAVCLLGTLCLLLGSLTALLLPRAIFIHISLFLSALIVALFCISRRQPVFGALLLFSTIAAVQLMVIPLLGPYFDRLRPRSETIVVQAPPVPTSTPEPAGPPPVPDPVKLAAARPPPAAEPRPPVELLPLQDRAEDRPAPPVPEEPAITPPVTGEFADLRVPEALIPTGLTTRAVYPDVAVPKPTLPLTLYSDCSADLPFTASGWMGYADAIELDECWEENPRTGSTCVRMAYNATYYWGGIAWQNPPNNWGDEPGGYDLSDAKELTFWARAENNKTIAEFKVGVRSSAPYADSTVISSGKRKLTRDWKSISVPLKGQNLSRIVTGFVCVVEGTDIPPIIYLDDIEFR